MLSPHLVSLAAGFESVNKELARNHEAGYVALFKHLPFLPCRCMPQGAVARSLEDRMRPTADGGAPRQATRAIGGGWVVPLNVAIDIKGTLADGSPKWPKEIKPRVVDVLHDLTVLLHAARHVYREPIGGFTDDAANYFNQIALRPSERWKSNFVWRGADGALVIVSEMRLGFGLSASSNIAQRFSDAIIGVFRRRFDAEEDELFALETDPARVAWLARRAALSAVTGRNERRLYAVHMYTDDPVFVVVGTDRLVRALRCWHGVTRDLGLKMAIARKRQLGSSLRWLGLDLHLPLGLLVVPPAKRLRACAVLSDIVEGTAPTFDVYRGLAGLLEHLLPFVGGDRTRMYGMYGATFRWGLANPGLPIVVSDVLRERCSEWRTTLASTAGVACTSAVGRATPPRGDAPVYMYSDAAKEGSTIDSGLGGYMHGLWWSHPLDEEDLDMPIVLLEFIAFVVGFFVFAHHARGMRVVARTDSLGTAQVFNRNSAKTAALQFAHGLTY